MLCLGSGHSERLWRIYSVGRYIVKRLAASVLLLFGITLIAFALTNVVPGDPAAASLGPILAADPAAVAAFKERYGLDQPLPVQYMRYLGNLAHGDLGVSEQSHRPVITDLGEYIPASVELAISSTLLVVLVGIGVGTLAALRRNSLFDQLVRILSLSATSAPAFWLGLLALYLLYFKLGWFPGSGRLSVALDPPVHLTGSYVVDSIIEGNFATTVDALQHLLLPAIVLGAYNIGVLIRFTRASVLDVAGEEYIDVARAKGLSPISVSRHVLRAALPSVISIVGVMFADVLTGTVLVETVFAWPGVGRYAFHSATTLDLPAIMGVTLFVAVVFVTVNLAVDLIYGIIDPRLRVT